MRAYAVHTVFLELPEVVWGKTIKIQFKHFALLSLVFLFVLIIDLKEITDGVCGITIELTWFQTEVLLN